MYPHLVDQFDPELHSAPYDYVLLYGQSQSLHERISRRFDQVYQNGELRVYSRQSPAPGT
jgi:hypothetical protein